MDTATYILPLATAIGSMGGFPEPPKVFKDLTKIPLFQWLLVFVLTWQGGGGQNLQKSIVTTLILFVIVEALKRCA